MNTNKDLERKREQLIPEIIEAYANIPLRGNPKNLREIFNVFRSDCDILFSLKKEIIDYKIDEIIELSNVNETTVDAYNERVKKLTNDLSQKSDITSKLLLKFAKELTYNVPTSCGHYEIHYNSINPVVDDVYKYYFDVEPKAPCPCNSFRKNAINNNLFNGPNRLRCYECDQQYFIYLLDMIILNKNFEEIQGLKDLLTGYTETSTFHLSLENTKILKVRTESNSKDYGRFKFPAVFDGLVSTLLVELLSDPKSNRKRFKRCGLCNKFFIAWDSKRKICYSDSCRKRYNREKREEQRESIKKMKATKNTNPPS